MLFAVWASDSEGALPARLRVREAHRARLRAPAPHEVEVLLAGPLLSEAVMNDAAMNGTLLIVRAENIDAVRAFVAADPYALAGVYGSVDIRPFKCGLGPLQEFA